MSLITLVLLSTSITLVFVQGSIFDRFRQHGPELLRELASCPLCLGVWIGTFTAGFAIDHEHLTLVEGAQTMAQVAPYVLGIGCLTGVLAMTLKRVWDALEAVAFSLDALSGLVQREMIADDDSAADADADEDDGDDR